MTHQDREWLQGCLDVLEARIVTLSFGLADTRAEIEGLKGLLLNLRHKPGMSADEMVSVWEAAASEAHESLRKQHAQTLRSALREQKRSRKKS